MLQCVADVKTAGMDVELAIHDVRQRYEMLIRYNQPVPAIELRQLRGLWKLWDRVKEKAHFTNFKLITIKSQFTSLALLEISDFADQIRKVSS